jgi:hypothetical protein
VIDALDECTGEEDARLILQLLVEAKSLITVRFRVFITSRPETPTRLGFRDLRDAEHQDFVFHEVSRPIIEKDISVFLHHELAIIRKKRQCSEGWPGESKIELLCQRAKGLLIYASAACGSIRDQVTTPRKSNANSGINGITKLIPAS